MGLYLCRSRKGQREGLLDLKGPRQLVAWSNKWLLFILPLFLVRRSEGEGGRESVLVSKMERVWVGESVWPWLFVPAGIWRNYRPTLLSKNDIWKVSLFA